MKRFWALMLLCVLLMGCMPQALAKSKQMEDGVPVWTEETVRQYVLDYVKGMDMDRLWGYYDLQIRRYMPVESFASFLTDMAFLTGEFIGLGSYRSFAEPESQMKVHVVHLCMEKQDMDMYFTHKDKEDDWEIMAIEFVPAEKEQPVNANMQVGAELAAPYTEEAVTVGAEPYLLEGVLTVPAGASAEAPVPACVMVHDFGPMDRDGTRGQTKLFADFADQFGKLGIAVLRYDKRTFAYPDAPVETLKDEAISDAIAAAKLLQSDPRIDSSRIIVVGVGLGGMVAPRIATDAEGTVTGMILIGSTTNRLIDVVYNWEKESVAILPKEEADVIKNAVRNIGNMKEEKARELTVFGRNGYYYWEAEQYDSAKLLKKLKLPLYYAQGKWDTEVSEDDGRRAYSKEVGPNARFATYESFRGLNHLLMDDLSVNAQGESEYAVETHLDIQAARTLAAWILNLNASK